MVFAEFTDSTSATSNFFRDFHGAQQLNLQYEPYSLAECEFSRLQDVFMYTDDYNVAEGLIYLKYLHDMVRRQVAAKINGEVPMEPVVYSVLNSLIRNYKLKGEVNKELFPRFSPNQLQHLQIALENVAERLPNDFYKENSDKILSNLVTYDPCKETKPLDPIFYIPLREDFPELDSLFEKSKRNSISFLHQESKQEVTSSSSESIAYPLETMFECYKTHFTNYTYEDFMMIVYSELSTSKSNEEVMEYFLETFGYGVIDLLSEIIMHRNKRIDYGSSLYETSKMAYNKTSPLDQPQIAGQVTVQSEKESLLSKKLRKMEKKDKAKYSSMEVKQTEAEYEVAKSTPIFKKVAVQRLDPDDYPHVHDQLRNHVITTKFEGISITQPESAIKKVTSDYAEFTIPGGKKGDVPDMDPVKVNTLDSIGQLVFRDIKEFNRIQSEVFPVAYHSNENLLVCAPTGAGKTNIALLAIVHEIRAHMEGSVIKKNDFKIVYVCPMKALATEMVMNFSKKLAPIGVSVKECTGDMQLTKKEIAETQMLVTTPEKWDVITRKGAVDTEVVSMVKLLIIDEVHLLNGSRGPVIEALVARTLRQVVNSQSMIRIVALSATLPGYLDVANFLKVNTRSGLFFFDNRFRSVPLTTSFIGIKKKNENEMIDVVCYEKVVGFIREGHQAMVFVTSRNATATVAKRLIEIAQEKHTLSLFEPEKGVKMSRAGYKSGDLTLLVPKGFGIHHAGMVRSDRLEVERLFRVGDLKVVVCTTTLAWGVNLPAHAVIIRGTSHYDATKSAFVDMDMLDVQQIFGRAGRPQYDSSGHGIIITSMANMSKYMGLMTSQVPIESQFLTCVADNLNAEIVLGTVSSLKEAMEWLGNTFLYVRIKKNPLVYGLTFNEIWDSRQFNQFLHSHLHSAAQTLEKSQMIRFDTTLGELRPTNYGRIASFYYISYRTMELFYEKFDRHTSEAGLIQLIAESYEFAQIQVRMDEVHELDELRQYNEFDIDLDFSSNVSKVIMLIQANISRAYIRGSSLISDTLFIMQTVVRLSRALFEIARDKDYAMQVSRTLLISQMLEQQQWYDSHPLIQFKELLPHLITRRSSEVLTMPIEDLREMSERELESLFRSRHVASRVKHFSLAFPYVEVDFVVRPITEGVIRIKLLISARFKWDNSVHGTVQHYYAWVEDPQHDSIYHMESFVISKKMCLSEEPVELVFTVPLTKPLSLEYFVRVSNSQFMHSETIKSINLEDLKLFTSESFQTDILDIEPFPKSMLQNESFESLYSFTHFNAVQSQVFHSCYHTDTPVILGAPTGSGKTIVAELCVLRLFTQEPTMKVVYIAPMKALVRERVLDWTRKFSAISKNVVEVTGDITPRSDVIRNANIIVTTPEKWDAMSRNWLEKDFVKEVGLMIIDEIHLLGEDRGHVLEVIVSRMNCINHKRNTSVRIIGLSTAMANPGDLAYWLNADKRGIFNFSSAVRPVPLEIHLQGFNVKHYCPRMAAMNKSVYQAICQYATDSSSLIFVSSRKQTRITGYELMKFLLTENNPQKWLRCDIDELERIKRRLVDQDLAQLLTFGIGMHHAALTESDRSIVEELYVNQKIQVLVATATLAWGVNFPARLVIVKGTEYFDGATKRYVDMPITDVIQMVGRAGRPQFDTTGVACVMVQENKKNFYRKFLFEPFPVESNLLEYLPDHVNAEIANENISTRSQLVEFIESTFFFRRLLANPAYYQLDAESSPGDYVCDLADSVIATLKQHGCVSAEQQEFLPEDDKVLFESTFLGDLTAQYYLSYKTVHFLSENLEADCSIDELLWMICQVEEYRLLPVRHNEDNINKDLVRELGVRTTFMYDSPCLKVYLMLKCYLMDISLPNQEYVLDLKSVLDQIIRIIHAMMSMAASRQWLDCTTRLIYLCQMLIQGCMVDVSNVMMLPYMNSNNYRSLREKLERLCPEDFSVPVLRAAMRNKGAETEIFQAFNDLIGTKASKEVMRTLKDLPILIIKPTIKTQDIKTVPWVLDQNSINLKLAPGTKYLFELNISREGSKQMNVYSKKFNKQKEEFWFLIFVNGDNMIFRKFSFSWRTKKVEVPAEMPSHKGIHNVRVLVFSDCYIGFDQSMHFRIRLDGN